MKIVLLSGQQGSGKTSLQKELTETWYRTHGKGAVCVNFADILYEMHDAVLAILYRYWPRRQLVKDGPLLQVLGTDWGRNTIDKEIWVKCLQKKIEIQQRHDFLPENENDLVIVGDCRFENEVDAFPDALRVRLECDEPVRKARCSMWRDNVYHPSEIGLDQYSAFGKFDLYLDTAKVDVAGCASLIVVQLEKNNWLERRKGNG